MGQLLFSAYSAGSGAELWTSDGTEAGTSLLKDINPGARDSAPGQFVHFGAGALFTAIQNGAGQELWITDGTAAGTSLVKDIQAGAAGSSPTDLTPLGNKVVFVANDGTHGAEPWVTDGTPAGTSMLADVFAGATGSGAESFIPFGGSLLFWADNGTVGKELWITDGTTAGTSLLKDINPGPTKSKDYFPGGTVFQGKVFFQARGGGFDYEVWTTDGTAAGTTLFKDINPGTNLGSSPKYFTVFGNKMLFSAQDSTGTELWISDGTPGGTTQLKDIKAGNGSSSPRYFTTVNGKIIFFADDGINGREVWTTDLTAAGTSMLKDIRPGAAQSAPARPFMVGTNLLFSAGDGTTGYELWSTDGTAAGTTQVRDIRAGSSGSYPASTTGAGARGFLAANDGTHGVELWITDGTSGGTALVKDIYPGTFGGSVTNLFALTDFVACFAEGTRIRTEGGEVAVEALQEGDRVVSAFGGTVPVRWIGRRTIEVTRHPRPWDVAPVRVAAGAFGEGRPGRDLYLSPDHAVHVAGVLVPVRYLVNGRTIRPVSVERVTYFHVELPAHDVILAEGLECESYLDTGNRGAFANAPGAVMLHADFAPGDVWAAEACAPLVTEGAVLEAARAGLLARAEVMGHRLTGDAGLELFADGVRLAPVVEGRRWRVCVPPGAAALRMVSRTWVPAETRAGERDARLLGVAVASLALDGVAVALDDRRLAAGWAAPEPGWRWTTGEAVLTLAGAAEVSFELTLGGDYWAEAARAA